MEDEGESIPDLSPSVWWLPAILGVPELIDASLQSLPHSSSDFPSSRASLFSFSLMRTLDIGFRVHSIQG